MKLPPKTPLSTEFCNAPGSTVQRDFALAARANPDHIAVMAETPRETEALQAEALARQYVLIVDRSGSMATPDGSGTRWDSVRGAVSKLVQTAFKYDIDHTVPLYVFDHEPIFLGECTDPLQVVSMLSDFAPRGSTNLAGVLHDAMSAYAGKARVNFATVPGTTFIILLDGGADNEEAVRTVLRRFADPASGYIDNHTQIAVSFVQIGDDHSATRFLQDLDDNLKPLDIVDTKKDDLLAQPGGVDVLLRDAIFD